MTVIEHQAQTARYSDETETWVFLVFSNSFRVLGAFAMMLGNTNNEILKKKFSCISPLGVGMLSIFYQCG